MRYQTDELTIESSNTADQLVIRWLGRSQERDPSRTLEPVLKAVDALLETAQSVEFDFRALEYMNSSTIRPILRLVEKASDKAATVRVLYDKTKNWQRLSFMAIGAVLAGFPNVEMRA